MRGCLLHNTMVKHVENTASKFFEFVWPEYRYIKNGVTMFVDVFAHRNSVTLAFEIETTSRHAIDNVKKAAAVGIPLWIIVPTRSLKFRLTGRLNDLELRPGGEPVKILLLGQLQQKLMNYLSLSIPANRLKDKQ